MMRKALYFSNALVALLLAARLVHSCGCRTAGGARSLVLGAPAGRRLAVVVYST